MTWSVYVIQGEGLDSCKVGIAKDPEMRLAEIQRMSPVKLVLVKAIPLEPDEAPRIESAVHKQLWSKRLWGEWFAVSPAVAINAVEATVLKLGGRPRKAKGLTESQRHTLALHDEATEQGKLQ